jgi:predicted kinase
VEVERKKLAQLKGKETIYGNDLLLLEKLEEDSQSLENERKTIIQVTHLRYLNIIC